MEPETATTTTDTTTTEAAAVARRKWKHTGRAVVMTNPDGSSSTYPYLTLPESVRDHVAFTGLSSILGKAADPDAAYDELSAGKLKIKTVAPVEVTPWRQALALAMVDDFKKAGTPITLDDAKAKVADMDGKTVAGQKTNPGVVKHYNSLTGKTKGYSLVELVTPPLAA